jgi:hypothetical protein
MPTPSLWRIAIGSAVAIGLLLMSGFSGGTTKQIVLGVLLAIAINYLVMQFPGRLHFYTRLIIAAFICLVIWGRFNPASRGVLTDAFAKRGTTTSFWWADRIRPDYQNEAALSIYEVEKNQVELEAKEIQEKLAVYAAKQKTEDELSQVKLLKGNLDGLNQRLENIRLYHKGTSSGSAEAKEVEMSEPVIIDSQRIRAIDGFPVKNRYIIDLSAGADGAGNIPKMLLSSDGWTKVTLLGYTKVHLTPSVPCWVNLADGLPSALSGPNNSNWSFPTGQREVYYRAKSSGGVINAFPI